MKKTLILLLLLGGWAQARTSARIDFIPTAERAYRASLGIPRATAPDGAYGIEGHGTSFAVYCKQGRAMGAAELAAWVLKDPAYRKGRPVYLLCCHTGKGRNPIARQLARILGVEVYAPTEKLWPLADGKYIVAGGDKKADLGKLGQMRKFSPSV
jgi:hypothetical protein